METQTKKLIGATLLAGSLALNAGAQSIFNGMRGPTDFQLDNRVSYTEKEAQNGKSTETTADNLILKYWNGKDIGVFGNVNIPEKYVKSGEKDNNGLGDISAALGPRVHFDLGKSKLDILSYLGVSFPTGQTNSAPTLGTGRLDYKAGFLGTLTDEAKKYEADFALDYTKTEGEKVSDELSGGLVLGGRVNNNLRLVAGPLFNYKLNGNNVGDYSLMGRINARYTPSGKLGKRMHFEVWVDRLLAGWGLSAPRENNSLTLLLRVNLGK